MGPPGPPSTEQIRAELDAVLASEFFSRAPSLAQFLGYVCRKALGGEGDQIKEYNIAVEAFGRTADFDQKADAIVRVEAHRLRKRLKQYYETEGASHTIQIVISPGQYVPGFVVKEPAAAQPAPAVEDSDGEEAVREAGECDVEAVNGTPPAPDPAGTALAETALQPAVKVLPLRPPESKPVLSRLVVALILGIAVLAGAVGVLLNRHAAPPPAAAPAQAGAVPASSTPQPRLPAATPAGGEGLRIAAGLRAAKYVDSYGNTWLGDRYFLGGQVRGSPAERILRTRDPALFSNWREGDFRYDIPLDPGTYELRLLFAERVYGSGNISGGGESNRLFHIFANGSPILENLDVISDASGSNTADVRVFKDITPAPDGFLHLRFSLFKDSAFLNGIEILPSPPGQIRPIRMVGADASVRDSAGQLWTADQYWQGGQINSRNVRVAGTKFPELYRSERYGNFSYAIPVAPDGRYALTLYFAEAWFGPSQQGGGGAGSRLVDVYLNGTALLRSFDVFEAAGGSYRAVERTFHGLKANAQGKLMISFVPVRNYAFVNAIEVTEEAR
jgi:hypothetical protein